MELEEILVGVGSLWAAPAGTPFPQLREHPPQPWRNLGETLGGVAVDLDQETVEIESDQRAGPVKALRVSEALVVETNLAAVTQENLARLLGTWLTNLPALVEQPATIPSTLTPPTRLGTIGYVHGGSGTQTYFQANGGLFITGDVIVVTAFYNQPSGVTGIFPAGSVSLYAQTHASVGTFESHYFVIPAGWGGDFVGTTFPGGGTGVMLATFWRGCNPTAPAAVMVAPTFAIGNPNVSLASQTFSAEKELLSVTGGDDGAIDTYGPINWTSIQRGVDFRISLDLKRSTPTVTSPTGLITSYNDGGAQWLAAAVLQLVGTGSPAIVPAAIITPTRAVPLHRGFDSPLWSLMFRGRSPYVDGPAQYEIPRGYYDSAETEDWDSEEQVGLPVSFVALADPTAPEQDRFGRLVVEDAAATA